MKKRKDGLYQKTFTVNGKRYIVYGKTQKECNDRESGKRAEIAAGTYKKGKDLTVDEYFDRWLDAKRGTVKETTLYANTKMLKTISEAAIDKSGTAFGTLKLKDIETQNVRDLQTTIKSTRSTRTTNDTISLLKSVFKSAMDERFLTWNPAANVKALKRIEEQARENIHRALTIEETKLFLKYAKGTWYYNLYVFLLNTGCRAGEAGALRKGDVREKGVQIVRTVTKTEVGGYMIGDDTKTESGRRFIPLNDDAKKALYDQERINQTVLGEGTFEMEKPIFKSPKGTLLRATLVNSSIKVICKKAGIEKFTVHAFRDTFATRCVESGMQAKTLQEIMGHSDISITMNLYAHVMDTTKETQLNAVNFV